MDSDPKQNSSTSPSELLNAALSYRRQGFCPIPVHPNHKGALIEWKNFQNELPTEKQIKEWWTKFPNANIALISGHNGLVILDIDVKSNLENKPIAEKIATAMHGKAPVVRTPSGGIHIHLRETDTKSQFVKFGDLGEFRADGKYTLVPPSKGYAFEGDLTEPLEVPDAWEVVTGFLRSFGIDTEQYKKTGMPQDVLSQPITKNYRNDTLASIAGSLRKRGATPDILRATLKAINQENCDPPLPDSEVESIANSINRYPAGQQSFPSNLKEQPLEEVLALKTISAGELQKRALEFLKPVESLPVLGRSGFLPEGWCILVAGAPKAGKTELIVAALQDWRKPILFISEEPEVVWARRLSEGEKNWEEIKLDIAFYIGIGSHSVAKFITETSAEVVIIDTVRNVIGGYDENDNSQVAAAINPVIKAARANNKTLILLHHMRKGGGDNGEGISGGHALFGAVDVGLEITRNGTAKNQRILKGWGRIFEIPELLYERTEEGNLIALGAPQEVSLNSVKKRACEALYHDEWQSVKEILNRLGDPKPSDEQLRVALKELALAGEVLRDPDISVGKKQGKGQKWKLPADPTSNDQGLRLEEKSSHQKVFNADDINISELISLKPEDEEAQVPLLKEENE
ncbi:MAG: bifunctional DNA primase/polymerase [Candidatus Andersenbacteria bacterium]